MAATTNEKATAIVEDESLVEEQLWDELEKEEMPAEIREARLQLLQKQARQFGMLKDKAHGSYTELQDEKAFLDLTTSTEKSVVHFFHADFRRCAIVDTHLEKLARQYFETKFAKINVETAKFLVGKLKVQMLPAIFCFKNGIVCDRVVGFEELGNTDGFGTEVLEKRLGKAGVIDYVPEDDDPSRKTIFGARVVQKTNSDSSDDDDGY
ncbi:thioredoxin domain-containing protein plp1-like [Gigantopelta aegis]|uniref:thioredoxin domain-containing protein plp1-like n=1 Tax=Gigantopelta aegis TaxID=1735272 RepID=UPI001B88D257|nr:thioredoxin domain-containing protein plp1-like [Gigantopelta aegis]